jgi:hypothetical protein
MVPQHRNMSAPYKLPQGFIIIEVPPGTPLRGLPNAHSEYLNAVALNDEQLAAKHNVATILIGLIQLILGLVTLYRARGDQIRLYGYAAFGLSVAPYAVMSIMNSAAALVTPEYPLIFLIRSPDMDRAEENGAVFDRVFAEIDTDTGQSRIPLDMLQGRTKKYALAVSIICALSPLAIVGGLSRFQAGQESSTSQKGWILSWIIASGVFPFCYGYFSRLVHWNRPMPSWLYSLPLVLLYVSTFVPAIGGMVTAFLMLRDYGVCTRF